MNIAFIGTGVMGESMARNLMKNGHSLTLYTRTPAKAHKLVTEGATLYDNIKDCVSSAEVIITMVGFPQDVEEVYLGQDGILKSAKPGALVIDMTTTSPSLWIDIAKKARRKNLRPLDAPVSGGDKGAREAALTVMAGGEKADFDAALPLFMCMAKRAIYQGKDGYGQHAKMANQIAIAGAVTGVAEAVRYGEKVGLDTAVMMDAISTGAAGSWQMSNNGAKMLSGDMEPGFFIKHFVKDLAIAMDESRNREIKLPVLKRVLKLYQHLVKQGKGNKGTQALIELYREEEY